MVCFNGKTEIIVRNDRGDLVRIDRVKAHAMGNVQSSTLSKS
jgi:hypothetical protein